MPQRVFPRRNGYRLFFPRDAIASIYRPSFIPAGEAEWPEEMLVIAVALEDTAKAYPVVVLNQREMVNDELRGMTNELAL